MHRAKWRERSLLACVVLLPGLPLCAQQNSIRLTVDPQVLNCVRAWGLTVARVEWDGHYQLPSDDVKRKLFSDLGATAIRLVVGRDAYYDEDRQAVKPDEADRVLGPQLDAIKKYAIRHYVISVITPPKFAKKYYTFDPSVDLDENHLRVECEDDFAAYIAAVLGYVKNRGDSLPEAVSLAVIPDLGGGLDGGCFYAPEQWKRVVAKVRAMLDRKGFAGVGLIGPETYSPEGSVAFLKESAGDGKDVVATPLAGLALSLGRKPEWTNEDYASVRRSLVKNTALRAGLWMLDEHTGSIGTDKEALLAVFHRMGRDLVYFGVDHWFWNFGFMTDASETSLLWGNEGNETPVYLSLKELWNLAPPGFEVHRINSADTGLRTFDSKAIDAFALVRGTRAVIVVINDGEGQRSFAVEGVKTMGARCSVYTGEAHRMIDMANDGPFGAEAEIPGSSVAFITTELDPSRSR